jgi:antigen flippase
MKAQPEEVPSGGGDGPRPVGSYGQVLRSSTIVGGSAALGMLISMVSVKGSAMFLGPAGIGELRQYQATLGTISAVCGLGLGPSAVRRVAHCLATGDRAIAARTASNLSRLVVLTGVVGWVATAALSIPISMGAFDDREHAIGLTFAGASVLLGSISAGYLSLLQAQQRVSELAIARVGASAATAALSIACFWWLGGRGIVPAIVLSATFAVLIHRRLARPHALDAPGPVALSETLRSGWDLAGLGFAMMLPTILACAIGTIIGSLVVRELGMPANGLYSAAWGLSVLFASFILNAMEADFFPRLSSVQHDAESMRRVVNEQTEVGILLAMPGVIGTIALAPLALRVFYTQDFIPAADLLVWLVAGVFGRVTSWPLSLILLARGRSRTYVATETSFAALHVCLCIVGIEIAGLLGLALAYCVQIWAYNVAMIVIANREIGMRWSTPVLRLIAITGALAAAFLLVARFVSDDLRIPVGLGFVAIASVVTLRGLASRLGNDHRFVAPLLRARVGAWLLGR